MKHTHWRSLKAGVFGALAAAVVACGPFHPGSGPAPAVIYFQNQSLDQADVFAVRSGGDPVRIGTVFPGHTDTLTVPADIANADASVTIVARILARSIAPQSGPVSLRAGDALSVRLPPDEKTLVVLPP